MPNVSYPGVYVQEVPSGVRPIQGASTSTAAFVGLAEKGPDDEARRVTSFAEYERHYGSFIPGSHLAESVLQFFNNGGRQCYIVRITRQDAAAAGVTVQNRAATPVPGVRFAAKNSGAWGNFLYLQIENGTADPGNDVRVSIRRQDEVDLVPEDFLNVAPLEVHDNLGLDPDAPNFITERLRRDSNLIDAQVLAGNDSLQRGIHRGGFNPTLPLGANRRFRINLDHDGYQLVELPAGVAAATDLAAVATAITDAVRALVRLRESTPTVAFSAFTCAVETVATASRLVLQSGTNTGAGTESETGSVELQNATANNAAVALRLGSGNGGRSEDSRAVRRPALADAVQLGDAAVEAPVTAAVLGTDGATDPESLTDLSFAAGFARLDEKTDFSLLAVPGRGSENMVDLGMAYCQNRSLQDVFFVGETDQDTDTAAEAESFRTSLTTPNSYGAVYFPWIRALDPAGRSSEPVLLPPSGFVAGLYARIDANRGVWKAPAGTEARINGAVGLAVDLTDIQQGNLNRINVNCLRRFPTAGIVSWGARTITSDPAYQYVPVRRMAIFLRVSIYQGIQFAVFEPNDEPLWASLRLSIGAFMSTLFRRGAFQGATPSQAFFVKVDAETTTQADIDAGVVNVLVGFAPLKPAEFVVVRISQLAGQSA
jgi:phage tail sheath protein FI